MAELFSISIYTMVVAYTGVGNLRLWAERRLMIVPNERSSHTRPTPSGGGVAIVATSLFGLLVFALLNEHLHRELWFLLTSGALVAVISWLDDLYTMQIPVRLVAHSLGALGLMFGAGYFHNISLPILGGISLGWLGFFITFLWIVGLINVYNFMDGIDGIAGTQAVIAGLTWALLGAWIQAPLVMALGLIIAASCLGFLGYNWPPARIFMGDVGSAFLGYSFAALAVLAARTDARAACIGLLAIWPFIFDSLFTMVRRACRGENIFQAHRSHLYQRLVIAGHSHRTVTLLYAGLALVGALLGLGWLRGIPGSETATMIGLPILTIALWAAVIYYEAKPGTITPVIN